MSKITPEAALNFAHEWIAAWNAHDLDAVLRHYADNFEFASPYISSIAEQASGRLQGKTAVRAYWSKALERIPELHFELVDVMVGVGSITLYYKGHRGMVAETLLFNSDSSEVEKAWACYSIKQ